MKRLILLIMLSGLFTNISQAQTWDEWFNQKKTQRKYLLKQIAALEVYLGYVKKGYRIAQNGLTLIGDIKDGAFSMDKDYFKSLETVSPVIRNSSKAAYAIALQRLILMEIDAQYERSRNDENFTHAEVQYLAAVYSHLKKECDALLGELMSILTDHELQMQDNQRLKNVDQIYENLKDMYAFLRTFNPAILVMQRSRERAGVEAMEKLVQP